MTDCFKDIQDNDITEYFNLVNFYLTKLDLEKYNFVRTHPIFFACYLFLRRHVRKR